MRNPQQNAEAENFVVMPIIKVAVIVGAKVFRADVADYIVKNLAEPRTYRAAFGVAY